MQVAHLTQYTAAVLTFPSPENLLEIWLDAARFCALFVEELLTFSTVWNEAQPPCAPTGLEAMGPTAGLGSRKVVPVLQPCSAALLAPFCQLQTSVSFHSGGDSHGSGAILASYTTFT